MKRHTRHRLPFGGSLGSHFPTIPDRILSVHRYYTCPTTGAGAPLRLPVALLGSLRFSLSLPSTHSPLSSGLCPVLTAHCHCRGCGLPVPGLLFIASTPYLLASWVGDMMALSSSRTTPLDTCPALRPRWCPVYSPFLFAHRTTAFQQLQTVGFPILTSQYGYLSSTSIPFSRLYFAACILAPSSFILLLPGLHVDFATGLLARL